jgi:hypothetical protein
VSLGKTFASRPPGNAPRAAYAYEEWESDEREV